MTEIIALVGTLITGFTGWFGSISTMLIGNVLVQLFIGLGLLGMVIGLVMGLISKVGKKKRR